MPEFKRFSGYVAKYSGTDLLGIVPVLNAEQRDRGSKFGLREGLGLSGDFFYCKARNSLHKKPMLTEIKVTFGFFTRTGGYSAPC